VNSEVKLVNDAAVLAGIIQGGERLTAEDESTFMFILREMRATTETVRLARKLAKHCNMPPLSLDIPE